MPRAKGADYRVDVGTGCWVWLRYVDRQGCPRVSPSATVLEQRAHREYYRRRNGPIEAGWDLERACDTTACVNPDHYRVVRHCDRLATVHQQASPLTPEDVRTIRSEARAGVSQTQLCERYGIASSSMSKIVAGRTWKDATYAPGVERSCKLSDCRKPFVTRRNGGKTPQLYCCANHRRLDEYRRKHGYYERREQAARADLVDRLNRHGVRNACSLDAPIADTDGTLKDLVAVPTALGDPWEEFQKSSLDDIVGDLSIEDAEALPDEARAVLQARLREAGWAPNVLMAA
jgi:hypothetical protein